ncbi:hypothetical protein C8R46DRAFT_1352016 [Mycena filopes]|nr:hypothetical protein C8R46DRAFT_1352016 [Mycena filopes]
MHRVPFLAHPTNESDSGDELQTESNKDKDPATNVPQAAQKVVSRFRSPSTTALRVFSGALHTVLITIHITLLFVWWRGLEHRAVFSLDQQRQVSLVITAVTTSFGTIYSALLVFVTQTLFMKRSLQITQPLTAIHDTSAAWTGIGSAILHLWRQTTVPGSALGVITALLYLSNILVLHISSPALFSVVAFNTSNSVPVGTSSHLPVYNWSDFPVGDLVWVEDYVKGALYFLPSVLGNTTSLGLHGGTLYDVLDPHEGVGNVQVNATGFNVTCGYPPSMNMSFMGTVWWGVSVDGGKWVSQFPSTLPAMIRSVDNEEYPPNLMLYATIQVVDSTGTHPPLLMLDPVMNDSSQSSVQIMQCDLTLVPQKVVLEARTQVVVNVEPDITKTASAWSLYTGTPSNANKESFPPSSPNSTGNMFINLWVRWYSMLPSANVFLSHVLGSWPGGRDQLAMGGGGALASVSDVYLIQQLGLHGPNATYSPNDTVALHDLENALSRLVAAMFWSTTHFLPFVKEQPVEYEGGDDVRVSSFELEPVERVLLPFDRGTVTVMGTSTLGRLDSSLIAIVAGLVASILLAFLALPSILFSDAHDIPIDGTGVLQAIWIFRNHPELAELLPQVEHPTTDQLRGAGMIRARLVAARGRADSL